MTYVQLVNAVLRRLREDEVSSVAASAYSKLIGDLVNVTKSEVENAWDWQALRQTVTVTTTSSPVSATYALTGVSQRFKLLDAWHREQKVRLNLWSLPQMNDATITEPKQGENVYAFAWNGYVNDVPQIKVYPTPDTVQNLDFSLVVPQAALSADADVIKAPWFPVIEGAVARAISERGEDGGNASDIQYGNYLRALSDAIAIEAHAHPEEIEWFPEQYYAR